MSRQLVNNVPQQSDLAARVAVLEKRCDGLLVLVQQLQAARGEEVLKTANAAKASDGYTFGDYDMNAHFQEPQR